MSSRFTEPVYRHPIDANALLVRGTQGCAWNKCNYCYISKGFPFMAATLEEMEDELRSFQGMYPATTNVWLVGSNPFCLPTEKLLAYVELIRKYYPNFSEIGMQGRATDIARKSLEEIRELRDAGVRNLFVGIETGNEEGLRLMNKGHTAAQSLEQLLRLNEADMDFTALYMLGCAGEGKGVESGIATAELLNKARPRRISTTGLTIFDNTPLQEMRSRGEFKEAPEREKIEELLEFVKHLNQTTHMYCMHYLNPVHFLATFPGDKDVIAAGLQKFLDENTAEEIEYMVNRESMHSL